MGSALFGARPSNRRLRAQGLVAAVWDTRLDAFGVRFPGVVLVGAHDDGARPLWASKEGGRSWMTSQMVSAPGGRRR